MTEVVSSLPPKRILSSFLLECQNFLVSHPVEIAPDRQCARFATLLGLASPTTPFLNKLKVAQSVPAWQEGGEELFQFGDRFRKESRTRDNENDWQKDASVDAS
jgi:hypothetical protein